MGRPPDLTAPLPDNLTVPSVGAMNVWTAPWSTAMQLQTKYLRLSTAVTLGSRFGDWRVCWRGGWSRHRLFYLIMLVRVEPSAQASPTRAPSGNPSSMRRRPTKQLVTAAFDIVRTVGLALPDVEATTKYDGSPVLRVDGIFMAGLATHPSAEPETLVVRAGLEERERLVEDAPETYYLTDYYRSYPLVLVRLSRIEPEALHDLLSVSWRMTTAKSRKLRPPLGFCG